MIRPIAISDTTITAQCEHCPGGPKDLPVSALRYAVGVDGSDNTDLLVLDCPSGCGSTTYHPVTGDGSCRELVQEMHVLFSMRIAKKARKDAVKDVRKRIETLGGQDHPVHV